MKNTFKVLFYLKKRALKPNEDAATLQFPIMGRITVNSQSVGISTNLHLHPSLWDVASNRAKGRSDEAKEVNRVLNSVHAKITQTYHDLNASGQAVTAKKVKAIYEGFSNDYPTLLVAYQNYIDKVVAMVAAKKRRDKTLENIKYAFSLLKKYMQDKLEIDDIDFLALTREFMTGFISWLEQLNYSTSVQYLAVRKCRKIVHEAKNKGAIAIDPFKCIYIKRVHKERVPLEESEIQKLINVKLDNKRSKAARDMFLFMIFTGLAFCDMKKMRYDKLLTLDNGDMWIIDERKKNDARFRVKLLPQAIELVERYRNYPDKKDEQLVFPAGSHSAMYQSIRHTGIRAGISKPLSLHVARHTFATTITLEQNVPLETVQKMLGHFNIETTQIYAKVLKNKINHDIDSITESVQKKYGFPELNHPVSKTA